MVPVALALAMAAGGLATPRGALAQGESGASPSGSYAFVGVNVLPMDGERVLENQTVLVRDGVIQAVGPAGSVSVPERTHRIEGAGRWLMPGLAEMHAHVPPVADGEGWPDEEALRDILFLYVANGVTTIRGMLGAPYQIELAEMLRRNELLGPTLYVGAPSLNGNSAPDPERAEALLRENHGRGYHFQKIHPGLTRASWDRMAETARELGFTFAGHVPVEVGLLHALETGMSTVDHLDGYVRALATGEVAERLERGEQVGLAELVASVDEGRIPMVVERTRNAGTWVVPTQYLWESLRGSPDVDAKLAQHEMRYVSAAQREAWRRQATRRPPVPPEASEPYHRIRRRVLEALADGGAGILMGTDSPQMFNVPGFALHRELAVMEQAGLTPFQILESGTRNVARYVEEELGMDGSFGTVAEGSRADLVLLEANPLDDLGNLTRRAGVMVRGRWVSGDDLEDGLMALASKHAAGG